MPKCRIKNAVFEYFWARVLSKLLPYFKPALSSLPNSKILRKNKKYLNLETKVPYLSIFGLEFEKNILLFEISVLEFVLL